MIKLDVQEYCHDCSHFEACVERSTYYFGDVEVQVGDTIVRCEHETRCRHLVERIKETKEEE